MDYIQRMTSAVIQGNKISDQSFFDLSQTRPALGVSIECHR